MPNLPDHIAPPILSKVREPDENGYVPFRVSVGRDALDAACYYDVVGENITGMLPEGSPMHFALQYSLDNGATWLDQENQPECLIHPSPTEIYDAVYDLMIEGLQPTDSLLLRMRIVNDRIDGLPSSDWSNVLFYNYDPDAAPLPTDETETEPVETEPEETTAPPEPETAPTEAPDPETPANTGWIAWGVTGLVLVGAVAALALRKPGKPEDKADKTE